MVLEEYYHPVNSNNSSISNNFNTISTINHQRNVRTLRLQYHITTYNDLFSPKSHYLITYYLFLSIINNLLARGIYIIRGRNCLKFAFIFQTTICLQSFRLYKVLKKARFTEVNSLDMQEVICNVIIGFLCHYWFFFQNRLAQNFQYHGGNHYNNLRWKWFQ